MTKNNSWEAKITLLGKSIPPDTYYDSYGTTPPDTFIISRFNSGKIASIYSDDVWNWTPYDPDERAKFYFKNWCGKKTTKLDNTLIEECKLLMFFLIFKRIGNPLSSQSLLGYMHVITSLARFSKNQKTSIHSILANPILLKSFYENKSGNIVNRLSSLLSALLQSGEEISGFKIIGGRSIKELRAKKVYFDTISKQHAPFPTSIHTQIISSLTKEIDDFNEISSNYMRLVKECADDLLLGKHRSDQPQLAKKYRIEFDHYRPTFNELLKTRGLDKYFSDKQLEPNVRGLAKGLSQIQLCCKLLIHCFSGMRNSEVKNLTYSCIVNAMHNLKQVHFIQGYTTKFNHGKRKTVKWVTSSEGVKAIKCAQTIAKSIYGIVDKNLSVTKNIKHHPLFISTAHLPFTPITPSISPTNKFKPTNFAHCSFEKLLSRILPRIEEEDICELENIDFNRSWRDEAEYKVGSRWPLKTHQFRRSLALYATNSGLVSLPSLRRQLKQITEDMAIYYANGSSFAKDIINNNEMHFGIDYQNTQPESQALGYIANVLLSDDRLFGSHGTWIQNNIKNKPKTVILEERETTLKKFKKGELSYKETYLGGCTEILPCNKRAMRSLVACIHCTKAVITLPKLKRTIDAQTSILKKIEPNTIHYKIELEDLKELQKAKFKYENQQKGKQT